MDCSVKAGDLLLIAVGGYQHFNPWNLSDSDGNWISGGPNQLGWCGGYFCGNAEVLGSTNVGTECGLIQNNEYAFVPNASGTDVITFVSTNPYLYCSPNDALVAGELMGDVFSGFTGCALQPCNETVFSYSNFVSNGYTAEGSNVTLPANSFMWDVSFGINFGPLFDNNACEPYTATCPSAVGMTIGVGNPFTLSQAASAGNGMGNAITCNWVGDHEGNQYCFMADQYDTDYAGGSTGGLFTGTYGNGTASPDPSLAGLCDKSLHYGTDSCNAGIMFYAVYGSSSTSAAGDCCVVSYPTDYTTYYSSSNFLSSGTITATNSFATETTNTTTTFTRQYPFIDDAVLNVPPSTNFSESFNLIADNTGSGNQAQLLSVSLSAAPSGTSLSIPPSDFPLNIAANSKADLPSSFTINIPGLKTGSYVIQGTAEFLKFNGQTYAYVQSPFTVRIDSGSILEFFGVPLWLWALVIIFIVVSMSITAYRVRK